MYQTQSGNRRDYHYDSVDELIKFASTGVVVNSDNLSTVKHYRTHLWDEADMGIPGKTDMARVLKLVGTGWRDGLDKIDRNMNVGALDEIAPPIMQKRRKRMADQGDELDMHRVWAGDLDHAWSTTRREARIGPRHMNIVADLAIIWGVDPEQLFWRGAAATRLADLLTAAGYSVQIAVSYRTNLTNDEGVVGLHAIVKDYAAQLDRMSVASTIALPAFFRTICLAWAALIARRPGIHIGIGSRVPLDADKDQIVAGQMIRDKFTAQQWVEQQIRDINAQHMEAAA